MTKKTKFFVKGLKEKYPLMSEQDILEIYYRGYGRGQADMIDKKEQKDNLKITKQFVEGLFLTGVQVGLMKKENEKL